MKLRIAFYLFVVVTALTARAEDGYRLWLRYDKIQDASIRKSHPIGSICVPTNSATSEIIRDELKNGLSGLLGQKISVSAKISDGSVVVGTPQTLPLLEKLNLETNMFTLGDDGYLIRTVTNENKVFTLIAAQREIGALYGAFHFLRLLQTGQDISRLNISERPALERRLLDHWDNPDGTVERGYAGKSLWQWRDLPEKIDPRYKDYARANASLGINGVVLNNVNAKPEQLSTAYLKKAAALADVFRPYGIRVYLTANFATPEKLGGLTNANPNNLAVPRWWKDKADEIYRLIPDFGGFLVKANSEGQPGPQDFGLTHVDGANMLAEALAPHGGVVMWRAFVYNSKIDKDRAKRAYLEFKPFDGKFHTNVFVQVKNGPIDFQPREPFHPLFGQLKKTSVMAELEITQENMGHSTDIVYLGKMWEEFLESDTYVNGPGSTVASTLEGSPMTGIAGVANVGSDRNWCGHDFAQANWYAFGRLAWDNRLSADTIAEEWARMTWGNEPTVIGTITNMLHGSWEACVSYEMPIGLHHIMEGGKHYDPKPNGVSRVPEYSGRYSHRADVNGIGFDRASMGSDAVSQYMPEVRDWFGSLSNCPPEFLLWFHHVDWDYRLQTGRTVWEELCFRYQDGVDYVRGMQKEWVSLKGKVDAERFAAVEKRLELQLAHATNWRAVCLKYFQSINHKPFPSSAVKP